MVMVRLVKERVEQKRIITTWWVTLINEIEGTTNDPFTKHNDIKQLALHGLER